MDSEHTQAQEDSLKDIQQAKRTLAYREQAEKLRAEVREGSNQANQYMNYQCMELKPNLRGRLSDKLDRATREARNADKLQELLGLLSKHHEVARILELLEEIG